ncbi:LGFP repeat-containing protein [Corynebacterium sp. 335C]
MRTTIARSATAVVLGAGLALGLAACSDDAKNAAETVAATATEGAAEATSAVEGAVEGATGGAAAGETVDIEGKQVPKNLADKYNAAGGAAALGALQEVTDEGGSKVAIFENARIYDIDGNPVIVKGEILNHWLERGGVESDLGKPLYDETEIAEGWKQEFQNGFMSWTHNGDHQFFETVELNQGAAPAEGEQAPAPAEGEQAPAPAEGEQAPAEAPQQ